MSFKTFAAGFNGACWWYGPLSEDREHFQQIYQNYLVALITSIDAINFQDDLVQRSWKWSTDSTSRHLSRKQILNSLIFTSVSYHKFSNLLLLSRLLLSHSWSVSVAMETAQGLRHAWRCGSFLELFELPCFPESRHQAGSAQRLWLEHDVTLWGLPSACHNIKP